MKVWFFPWKVGSSPRRGHVHLGEPRDKEDGLFGSPRRGVACLCEGRLHLGESTTVQGLCLQPVCGWSRGPICDCCGLLQEPLYDLFEYVVACLRVTCLDVNVCALTCRHMMNCYV